MGAAMSVHQGCCMSHAATAAAVIHAAASTGRLANSLILEIGVALQG